MDQLHQAPTSVSFVDSDPSNESSNGPPNEPNEPNELPQKSRVPYENNTYIDWMKESALHNTPLSAALAPSRKWCVLIVMALLVGYTTSFVDLASVWLNDLRKGVCLSRLDRWSLLNPYSTCPADDWYDWSRMAAGHATAWGVVVNGPIYVFFVALFVSAAGWLAAQAPLMKQSGIPEMKLIVAGFNYHLAQYLGPRMLVCKTAALVLVVGSGVWLGSEGPLVHIAGCLLSVCFRRVYTPDAPDGLRRELLSAAAATGIAVAFNSPVGGVFFVVELLPSYFSPTRIMWNSFVCATIALVAVYGFKAFTEGEHYVDDALFDVSFGNVSWFFLEAIPFVSLGLLGGVYGSAYTRTYLRWADKAAKRRLHTRLAAAFGVRPASAPYLELVLVALATALATFPLSMTKMPLRAFLKVLFTDCPTGPAAKETNSVNFMCDASPAATACKLAYVFVSGFFLSAYSYGLPLPGGVLMPSLVLGATVGRLFGIVAQAIQNGVDPAYSATCTAKSCLVSPSSYAVVGAASFTTGITKLTLSVVVIIVELTGAVSYVIPIMIGVITAKFFNDWLCDENIYDAWLTNEFNRAPDSLVNATKGAGLCLFSSRMQARIPDSPISDVMSPLSQTRHLCLFPAVPYDLREVYGFLADDVHEGYPLVSSEQSPHDLGYLPKKDIYKSLLNAMGNVQSQDAMVIFSCVVPSHLREEQARYEASLSDRYRSVHSVPVQPEQSTLIVKDSASVMQVLEIFQGLQLNYLIIREAASRGCVSGFIDRFMLSRMMHSGVRADPGREFEIDD